VITEQRQFGAPQQGLVEKDQGTVLSIVDRIAQATLATESHEIA
jgi:hypothetical protein